MSSSALSTATAVSALALLRGQLGRDESPTSAARQQKLGELIFGGLHWLAAAQNPDGGWGDTDRSLSNIATTMLVRAAFQLTCVPANQNGLIERADRYIASQGGVAGLRKRYGRDKTFAVPILTNCALAGLIPWKAVSPLPFELACFPQSWFRFLRLPVVSYAIPALVAIGQTRYFHRRPRNPLVRWWRGLAVGKSLRVLEQMQPESGGFLEATPLTSFVVMSLASIGQARHPVARRGLDFLLASVRADGSWPIDTNLATWVTTLSINALAAGELDAVTAALPDDGPSMTTAKIDRATHDEAAVSGGWGRTWPDKTVPCQYAPRPGDAPVATTTGASPRQNRFAQIQRTGAALPQPPLCRDVNLILGRTTNVTSQCVDWLLDCQCRQQHPYTGAAPGGWGWSDLSGSVPDADDTSGALLALAALNASRGDEGDGCGGRTMNAAAMGVGWLLDLQNSDGGWPTFCRGWGALPFDRSGTDLTAHAIRALHAWRQVGDPPESIRHAVGHKAKAVAASDAGRMDAGNQHFVWPASDPTAAALQPGHRRGNAPAQNSLTRRGSAPATTTIHGAGYGLTGLRVQKAIEAGFGYLARQQRPDGSWSPLWFGNQNHPQEENPVYGTARVLLAYSELRQADDPVARRGLAFLASQQRSDGAWGASPSVEETALAVESLLAAGGAAAYDRQIERGLAWLIEAVETGHFRHSSPIGFYFAKLWYYETLYPMIFTVAALGRAVRQLEPRAAECRLDRAPRLPQPTLVEPTPA